MDAAIKEPIGSFYRVEPDGKVEKLFGDIIVNNLVVTSPDDRTRYMSDTRRYKLLAFDLEPEHGDLSNRRIFADYTAIEPGRPDGSCVDAEGYLWNAVFTGSKVIRYAPTDEVDRIIDLPVTNPTCACFGGPDLDTLYISTATKFIEPDILANEPWSGWPIGDQARRQGIARADVWLERSAFKETLSSLDSLCLTADSLCLTAPCNFYESQGAVNFLDVATFSRKTGRPLLRTTL